MLFQVLCIFTISTIPTTRGRKWPNTLESKNKIQEDIDKMATMCLKWDPDFAIY
jgi:hypothetical protein